MTSPSKAYLPVLSLFLIAALLLSAPLPIASGQPAKKAGIDLTQFTLPDSNETFYRVMGMEREDAQTALQQMQQLLEQMGFEVVLLEEITYENIQDLDVLILGKIDRPEFGYSDEEVNAIATWFLEGGKFLWVSADSDYTEPYLDPNDITFKAAEPNKILEAIGSTIRADYMSVEDPENNAGAPYRVVANRTVGGINDHEVTENVDRLLVHGPTGLAGFIDGEWVDFETLLERDPTVTWLARTGPNGTVLSHDGVPPNAYEVGFTGRLYLVAIQMIPTDSGKYSKVLVSGDSPIGSYNMFKDEYKGVSLDGITFFQNVIEWGTTVEMVEQEPEEQPPEDTTGEEPTDEEVPREEPQQDTGEEPAGEEGATDNTMMWIAAIAVILVILAAVAFAFMKKS